MNSTLVHKGMIPGFHVSADWDLLQPTPPVISHAHRQDERMLDCKNILKHHHIIKTNLPKREDGSINLSQVKIILLGEEHNNDQHRKVNSSVIDVLYNEDLNISDIVFVECNIRINKTTYAYVVPNQAQTEIHKALATMVKHVTKEILVIDWDHSVAGRRHSDLIKHQYYIDSRKDKYKQWNKLATSTLRSLSILGICYAVFNIIKKRRNGPHAVNYIFHIATIILPLVLHTIPAVILRRKIEKQHSSLLAQSEILDPKMMTLRNRTMCTWVYNSLVEKQGNTLKNRKVFVVAGNAHLIPWTMIEGQSYEDVDQRIDQNEHHLKETYQFLDKFEVPYVILQPKDTEN